MTQNADSWLERLRGAEERVKHFWVGLFTAVTTLFIIGLWAAYGALTASPRQVALFPSSPSGEVGSELPEESRLALISSVLKRGYAGIVQVFDRGYNFKIRRSEENFIYEDLSVVPPTALP